MKLDDLLLLVQAGYSKDEISSMAEKESNKKPEPKSEKKPEPEPEPEPKKKLEPEPEPESKFDYDKLAETIIAKMQAKNRSANLDKNKSTEDWLSQLSLKF